MDGLRIQKRFPGGYIFPLFVMISSLNMCILFQEGHAEIYKFVKNGVVHYSNQPPTNTVYNTLTFSHSTPSSKSSGVKRRVVTRSASNSTTQSQHYHDIINTAAKTYRVPPDLIRAIIQVESNYNPDAVSPKGAEGLMQLMPATAKRFGVSDSFDPEENITGGVKYLRFLLNEFGEKNLNLVLAGYNAGENAVKKYGNSVPPYSETQRYVKKVRSYYRAHSPYAGTKSPSIYRYVNKDGVVTFTNVPRVTKIH